ncbi:MAG: hypothetical protein HXK70_03240 [Clostridiales bacterium]|nr:hypothetical protein [Clostridiales bacterium]
MLKLDFFVEKNTEDSDEIKKMVKALDDKKCTYKVYEINQNNINGKSLPILKITLDSGEILEYDKEKMFREIVNLSKVGMPE